MKREYADHYAELERRHWWFRARRCILRDLLAREVAWQNGMDVLEIGHGPGENLYTLYPPDIRLAGLEPDPHNAEVARRRGPVPVYEGVIEALPAPVSRKLYDVITMFDVLEHIRDEAQALRLLRNRLKSGGRLLLSVPTYSWLWGLQDEVSHHFRRYTRGALCRLLQAEGFRVDRATYFNTFLFPMVATFRLAARLAGPGKRAAESDFDFTAGPLDKFFYATFAAERIPLRTVNFPFGVSLFVAATSTGGQP